MGLIKDIKDIQQSIITIADILSVSNVTNMCGMFHDSKFNGDISNWDGYFLDHNSMEIYQNGM